MTTKTVGSVDGVGSQYLGRVEPIMTFLAVDLKVSILCPFTPRLLFGVAPPRSDASYLIRVPRKRRPGDGGATDGAQSGRRSGPNHTGTIAMPPFQLVHLFPIDVCDGQYPIYLIHAAPATLLGLTVTARICYRASYFNSCFGTEVRDAACA